MTDERIPDKISTEDAVALVLKGQALVRREITDLRALIEGVQRFGIRSAIQCSDCRIVTAKCDALEIDCELEFRRTTFEQYAHFDNVTFTQKVEFSDSKFTHDTFFEDAEFTENAIFIDTTFAQNTNFMGARFRKDARFDGATFTQKVSFLDAAFTGRAAFGNAALKQDADFREATFHQDAFFANANLSREVRWERAKVSGRLRFAGATFEGEARLNLHDIDLRPGGGIDLKIDQIGRGKYYFQILWAKKFFKFWQVKKLFQILRADECLIKGEDSADEEEVRTAAAQYNTLRDNFRAMPSTDDEEDRCHYKYMDLKRRSSGWGRLHRFFNCAVLKWCWGYGVYPRRMAVAILGVILAFGGVYMVCADESTMNGFYAGADLPPETCPVGGSDFHWLYFSLITFTTIGYGDYAPLGNLRWVASIEGLVGLLLMSLLTVSIARKFIR